MNMAMYICLDRYIYSTFEHKIFNCMIGISDERIFRTFKDSYIQVLKCTDFTSISGKSSSQFAADNAAWAKIVWKTKKYYF